MQNSIESTIQNWKRMQKCTWNTFLSHPEKDFKVVFFQLRKELLQLFKPTTDLSTTHPNTSQVTPVLNNNMKYRHSSHSSKIKMIKQTKKPIGTTWQLNGRHFGTTWETWRPLCMCATLKLHVKYLSTTRDNLETSLGQL